MKCKKKCHQYMNQGGVSFYNAYLDYRFKLKGEIKWNKK